MIGSSAPASAAPVPCTYTQSCQHAHREGLQPVLRASDPPLHASTAVLHPVGGVSRTFVASSASAVVSLSSDVPFRNVSGAMRRALSRSAAALRPVASVRSCFKHTILVKSLSWLLCLQPGHFQQSPFYASPAHNTTTAHRAA